MTTQESNTEEQVPLKSPHEEQADTWLASLTLEQKLSQLMCPFFSTHRLFRERQPVGLERYVEKYGIGFIHVGRGNARKTRQWIKRYQTLAGGAADVPVMFCGDAEQGLPHTFRCGSEMPWQMALGVTQQPEVATEVAEILGQQARSLGLDVLFGPCVDVNINPLNKVIATRAFSSDAALVAAMSAAFVEALQAKGVAATLKHFPGHGGVIEDSHITLPEDASHEALFEQIHFHPFEECIKAGAMAVMTAHLYVKSLDPTHMTTVSRKIMTELLRDTLGFEGLLFTDSLNMGAINQSSSKRKAALDSLFAGCDVMVHPAQSDRLEPFLETLLRASDRGELKQEHLDRMVRRVLLFKAQLLDKQKQAKTKAHKEPLCKEAHTLALKALSRRCISVVGEDTYKAPDEPFLLVAAVDSERKKDHPTTFMEQVKALSNDHKTFLLTEESSLLEIALMRKKIAEFEGPIILSVHSPMLWFKGRSMLDPHTQHKIHRLFEGLDVHTTIVFGSPYILHEVPGEQHLCGYGPAAPIEEAAIEVLAGKLAPQAFVPVPWPGIERLPSLEQQAA